MREKTSATPTTGTDLELVRRIAGHMARHLPAHVDRDELVALGNLGLVEARARFDASRGVPFGAYGATRIRGAILDGLRKIDPLSRGDRAQAKQRARTSGATCFVPVQETELSAIGPTADDTLEMRAELVEMLEALEVLPQREREVVCGHFFLERPLKSMGCELGVSESRVSQILNAALKRLRSILDAPVTFQHEQEAF